MAASDLTPLFRALRVTQAWFNRIAVGSLGDEIDPEKLSDSEVENAFEDLML